MSWDEAQGPVLYRAKRAHGFAKAEKSFDPQDFLARLLMHVPQPRLHTIRYYGNYSNVARARRREHTQDDEQAADAEAQPETPSAAQRRRLRRLWAQLIRRVYEVDPLTCPC